MLGHDTSALSKQFKTRLRCHKNVMEPICVKVVKLTCNCDYKIYKFQGNYAWVGQKHYDERLRTWDLADGVEPVLVLGVVGVHGDGVW